MGGGLRPPLCKLKGGLWKTRGGFAPPKGGPCSTMTLARVAKLTEVVVNNLARVAKLTEVVVNNFSKSS